jgi:tetratricopeptide (TPR) repeat protein
MKRAHTTAVALLLTGLCLAGQAGANLGRTKMSVEQSLGASRAALREKHNAKAIRILQNALQRFPGDERLQVQLGRAYLYDRQDDRAVQLFRQVLQKDPASRPAKLGLARALGYRRDYEPSNQLYRELLKANADDEAASVGLVRNLIHQKRAAEARQELDRALARHPHSVPLKQAKLRLEKMLTKTAAKRGA